jgi:hypothetical protein
MFFRPKDKQNFRAILLKSQARVKGASAENALALFLDYLL